MTEQAIGAAIRGTRVARGLSLRGLAARLEVSPATLSALETGGATVTVPRLRRIASVLDTTVESLLRGEVLRPPVDPVDPADPAEGDWRDYSGLRLDPILEAAARVFVRHGYHAATTRQVAAEAGLSVAGVYHHHASKQVLLVALLDVTMHEITWRLRAARDEAGDPVRSFELMVESLALFHSRRGDLAFLGASEMRAVEEPDRSRVVGLRDEVQHLLDAQVDRCLDAGRFTVTDPRVAARAVATMCTALPSWFRPAGALRPEDVARRYAGYAVAMMGPV